jgi:hypothetical protein
MMIIFRQSHFDGMLLALDLGAKDAKKASGIWAWIWLKMRDLHHDRCFCFLLGENQPVDFEYRPYFQSKRSG